MTTPYRSEISASRARSLSQAATPKSKRVPLKLIRNVAMKRTDSTLTRCAAIRYRYAPRTIDSGDHCPACDGCRVEVDPRREVMQCPGCGWACGLGGDA